MTAVSSKAHFQTELLTFVSVSMVNSNHSWKCWCQCLRHQGMWPTLFCGVVLFLFLQTVEEWRWHKRSSCSFMSANLCVYTWVLISNYYKNFNCCWFSLKCSGVILLLVVGLWLFSNERFAKLDLSACLFLKLRKCSLYLNSKFLIVWPIQTTSHYL